MTDTEIDIWDQAAEVDQDPVPGLGDPPEVEAGEDAEQEES